MNMSLLFLFALGICYHRLVYKRKAKEFSLTWKDQLYISRNIVFGGYVAKDFFLYSLTNLGIGVSIYITFILMIFTSISGFYLSIIFIQVFVLLCFFFSFSLLLHKESIDSKEILFNPGIKIFIMKKNPMLFISNRSEEVSSIRKYAWACLLAWLFFSILFSLAAVLGFSTS